MMLSRPFGSASVAWSGCGSYQLGLNEGGVAAVFRRSAVRVTTMPEGNDREHDGHHRQGHGFGREDPPAVMLMQRSFRHRGGASRQR